MTDQNRKAVDIGIVGMHCASCALAVEKAVSEIEGVDSVTVNLATEKVRVVLGGETIPLPEIEEAIKKAGFTPAAQTITIRIGGMTCAMCVAGVEKILSSLPGVVSASVNLGTEQATISYHPGIISVDQLKKAITSAGYTAHSTGDEGAEEEQAAQEKDLREKLTRSIIGFAVSAVLMLVMYLHPPLPLPMPYFFFLVSTPFFLYLAYPIFRSAVRSLSNGILDMDVMYAMGIGTAYGSSVLSTFSIFLTGEFNFYETAVMLAAFLTLGRYLEARAKGRTGEAIRSLISLQPKRATLLRNGTEIQVPADEIQAGDQILVRTGEAVAVDGIVIKGEGSVDESLVTGESVPVMKMDGSEVIGGTILTSGTLTVTATRIGRDTVLAQIIRMVEEAQGTKPPVQRIADSVVSIFIPFVLLIATVSFFLWYVILGETLLFATTALISVLVVACPCALGLATPTAITVGLGRGAELGILIRSGETLERSGAITTVAVDKTGTLTMGRPVVTDVVPSGRSEDDLLYLAGSVEKLSLHPLATAIAEKAGRAGIAAGDVTGFETIGGQGVLGVIDGQSVMIGTRAFLESRSVSIPKKALGSMVRLENEGKTVPLVAVDGRYAGLFAITDPLKPTSATAVKAFTDMGLAVVMITGDNERTARVIGEKVGISKILSGVLPDRKALEVQRIQEQGGVVAFIGDGINDAPALAQADVGIAISGGTDVAVETGGIVLMHDDLIDAAAAIQLSQKVMGRIRGNLFWAFIYNILLIPIAAGLLTPFFGVTFRPEYAGLAMALSSVTIVSLSLLLKGYTPPAKKLEVVN